MKKGVHPIANWLMAGCFVQRNKQSIKNCQEATRLAGAYVVQLYTNHDLHMSNKVMHPAWQVVGSGKNTQDSAWSMDHGPWLLSL
eukprot:657971-Pleurochrysis_carterae.AAC.2